MPSTPVTKQHRTPCKECPWRKASAPGWLGGALGPDEWREVAHSDTVVPCHMAPLDVNGTAQCAGLAVYRANVCKSPRDPTILRLPRDNGAKVFETPTQFMDHHKPMHDRLSAITQSKEHNREGYSRRRRTPD